MHSAGLCGSLQSLQSLWAGKRPRAARSPKECTPISRQGIISRQSFPFPGEAHRIRKNHSRCANPESTSKLLAAAAAAQENGLLDPDNGQFVIADAKLRAITGQERFKAFSAHPFPVSGPRVELRVRQTVLPCEFLALPISECLRQRARPPSTPAVQSLLKQHFIKDEEEGDDEEEGEGGGEGEEGEGEDGDA